MSDQTSFHNIFTSDDKHSKSIDLSNNNHSAVANFLNYLKSMQKPLWEALIIGSLGTWLSRLAEAPFDRVKILQQTQGELIKAGRLSTPFLNSLDCFTRIIRTEGFWALWRGALAGILRSFPNQLTSMVLNHFSIKEALLTVPLSLFISYPLDVIQTKLAADVLTKGSYHYKGFWDCFWKVIKTEKWGFHSPATSLYASSFLTTLLGVVLYRSSFASVQEGLKSAAGSQIKQHPFLLFLISWFASSLASFVSFPLDTIRRRMVVGAAVGGGLGGWKYSGPIDCVEQILKREGTKALWQGFMMSIIRGWIGTLAMSGYEAWQERRKLGLGGSSSSTTTSTARQSPQMGDPSPIPAK